MSNLKHREYERLNWDLYPNMVRIRTIADGSCFFHAIAKAYSQSYKSGVARSKDGTVLALNPQDMIWQLRKELSQRLAEPINVLEPNGVTHYDILHLNRDLPFTQLEAMQQELKSKSCVNGQLYVEYVGNVFNKDIYILDSDTQNVVRLDPVVYRERDSIVLLYIVATNHYELVGLEIEPNEIETQFTPSHPFIVALKQQMF